MVNPNSAARRLLCCIAAVASVGVLGGCGGAKKTSLSVSLSEWKVGAGVTTFDHGMQTLRITNAGKAPHELLVFKPAAGIDPHNLPVSADGDINENSPDAKKISDGDNVDPGKSQTRTVDFSTPGTYVLLCNIAGHYKQGMSQVVTVK